MQEQRSFSGARFPNGFCGGGSFVLEDGEGLSSEDEEDLSALLRD